MKRKLMVKFLLMIILFPALFFTSTLAAETETHKENLNSDLRVEILEDGRVAPVEKVEELREADLDLILARIGYSEYLIEIWNSDRKRELVGYGGKVLESPHYNNNNDYYNSEFIRQLQDTSEGDVIYVSLGSEATYTDVPGGYQEGKWSANLSVVKIGETSKEYQYLMRMDYFWEQQPIINYGDSATLNWGLECAPIPDTESSQNSVYYLNKWIPFDNKITDTTNFYGLLTRIKYDGHLSGSQVGYLEKQVWISKELTGYTLYLGGEYNHPYGPKGLSSFFQILEGNRWLWGYNFIVS